MLKIIDGNTTPQLSMAEYIWFDGKYIFSTTKLIEIYPTEDNEHLPVPNIKPISIEDGDTEYILNPVHYVLDPFQKGIHYIILCDIYIDGETTHKCNTRAHLNKVISSGGDKAESLVTFTQQFYLYKPKKHLRGIDTDQSILGWDNTGIPPTNNPKYGVGEERVSGREVLMEHLRTCMDSGLLVCGFNAEDDLGKWSFKVGYRNFSSDEDDAVPLISSDHLIFARYLLQRICEKYNLAVDYIYKDCKLKVNYSTWATREKRQKKVDDVPTNITDLISTLENYHSEYLLSLQQISAPFKLRIPLSSIHQGYGHIEDERPKGDSDPYMICSKLIEHSCGLWIPR